MKKTTCSLCGKEINKGLLGIGGNAHTLSLAGIDVDCCPQCHRIYDDFAKRNWMRFYTKLQNAFYREHEYADLQKLLTREEVVKYFLAYYQDSTHYTEAESYSGVLVPALDNDLANAAFLTLEGGLGGYVTLDGIAETCTERIQEENQKVASCNRRGISYTTTPWAFGPEDISCLEYAFDRDEDVVGDMAMRVYIKLNDFRQITYKPCVIYGIVTYPGLHSEDFIREQIYDVLHVEHLPIVEKSERALRNSGQYSTTQKGSSGKSRGFQLSNIFDFFQML